jgi:tetratricopeptide (TPR) repeat protein
MKAASGNPLLPDRRGVRQWLAYHRYELAVAVALIATIFASFGPVCRNDFINFDDGFYVTDCPAVQGGLSAGGVHWAWTSVRGFWHPLTWMSLQLDHDLYGLRPAGYHLTNLLLHTATSLLLWCVLRRTTGDRWHSALAAALFALHPLRVEPVAWVAERKGVLSTFLAVLTVAAYARYAARPGRLRYLAVLAAYAAGLAAKPMLVTLPAALLLLDYWPLGRTRWVVPARSDGAGTLSRNHACSSLRWLVAEKIPLLALALAVSWLTMDAERQIGALGEQAPLDTRCGDALVAYTRYLGKTLCPAGLAVFYPRRGAAWSAEQMTGAGVLLTAVSAAALLLSRRRPAVVVGWAWFLGTLVPVVGLVQIGLHTVADRYAYLPHIGLVIMAVWGPAGLVARAAGPLLRMTGALALLAGLAVCSRLQVEHWRDSEAVWRHALAVTDDNYLAHNNLGTVLMVTGRQDEALEHFRAALAILPSYADARANLGVLCLARGRLAEASEHFAAVVRLRPQDVVGHSRLGDVLWSEGRTAEAARSFAEAVRLDPGQPEMRNRLGVALLALAKPEEARAQFAEAVRMAPSSACLHGNLGAALYNQGRVAEAARCLELAVRLDPGYTAGREKLATALLWLGRLEEASTQYVEALRNEPHDARLHDGLGTVREARGQLAEAAASYRRAVELAPGVVKYHRDLAGALGGLGRPDEAAAEFAEASRLDPAWPSAVDRAARTLVTDPEPGRRCPIVAVQMARQACSCADCRPEFRATLAAAYAAAGRPAEATAVNRTVPGAAAP